MSVYRVRLELWVEVEADDLEEAKQVALSDLAFGRVSVAEAVVTDWDCGAA